MILCAPLYMKLRNFTICWQILIIKPTRRANFSNLFVEWNCTCFGQFLCSSSVVFHCRHNSGACHTACVQDQDVPLLCVQWKTPDERQRNCPKHVLFYSKNKLEKLEHLIGFIIRIYPDGRSPERQIRRNLFLGPGRFIAFFSPLNIGGYYVYHQG